jgi:hypothetical protein
MRCAEVRGAGANRGLVSYARRRRTDATTANANHSACTYACVSGGETHVCSCRKRHETPQALATSTVLLFGNTIDGSDGCLYPTHLKSSRGLAEKLREVQRKTTLPRVGYYLQDDGYVYPEWLGL